MVSATHQSTFGGLPLTPEQDAEVRHYIKKEQHDAPWDTPELAAMLQDMLETPGDEDGERGIDAIDDTNAARKRAAACVDEAMNPIEASEKRDTAMETEAMRGPRH